MTRNTPLFRRSAAALLAAVVAAVPLSRSAVADAGPVLDFPDAPRPKVEIDISRGLLNDLFGVTDAALAGVAAALQESGAGENLTAEQVAAVKQVVGLTKDSIRGVRLRVYDGVEESVAASMLEYFETHLGADDWERVLRVNDGDEQVRVALRRGEGSVRGVFLLVLGDDETVTVHVDCDLSPERAEQIARTVTATALDLGLGEAFEKSLHKVRENIEREMH